MISLNKLKDRIIKSVYLRDLLILSIFVIIVLFFFRSLRVVGESMEPTLVDGQRGIVLLNRLNYYTPERNDIVVLKKETYSEKLLIKRILGVPGDKIEIKDNVLYINDTMVEEPYVSEKMDTQDLVTNLEEGEYFVLGDNRNNSADSRLPLIGSIEYEEIIGKLIFDLRKFSVVSN